MPENLKKQFEELKQHWPSSIVARSEVGAFSGGSLNSGTMANEDCKGTGPKDSFYIGRKKVYPVDSLIEWMQQRARG